MVRKRRRANYSAFADDDASRDLRVFVSSLVIGICIGAFGFYFFVERPHGRELANLRAVVAREQSCTTSRDVNAGQREELESRLSSCRADLARMQRAAQQAAQTALQNGEVPPVPRSPPGRESEQPLQPSSILPPPVATPPMLTPAPAPSPAAPDAPFTRPAGWPPLPKAPPAGLRAASSPQPAPESEEVVAQPVEPVPQAVAAQVWPASFPPRPRAHPPRPSGTVPTVETIEAAASGVIDGPTAALSGAETVTLDVGEEQDVSGYKLRLIAVSRRSSGRYCVVGGNGMVSQRLASGVGKRVTWNGHSVTLQATVRDGDTCQVALRPG